MPEGFRDCFVGEKGYEAVKEVMKRGNKSCTDLAKCLQERNEAEMAYVRALRKNGANLEALAGRLKGTFGDALATLATQTHREADAHSLVADTMLNDLSIPMRTLAETQTKDRKSIEEGLNGKYKEWNSRKQDDDKYRTRQFEKCREIENLYAKITEVASGSKSSSRSKTSSVSTPLVMSCVLPASRHSSLPEKPSSHADVKHQASLESQMKKAEEDLERTEQKYHLATRNVEIARQSFDVEMCRGCDDLQKIEFSRLNEMASYLGTFAASIQMLTQTMNEITRDLFTTQVNPENDILVQVKSSNQPTEMELLLYDIYAENEDNVMSEQRRVLSLKNWMERLRKDVDAQRQTRNADRSESPEDDGGSSSDGAMCSKKDVVRKSARRSSSSNDDEDDEDGGMHYHRKKKEVSKKVSSAAFVDRRGATMFEALYRASLYKMECTHNRLKHLPAPNYEYSNLITRTFTEKNIPTTLLRLPAQSATRTPPSAPSAVRYFAETMPTYAMPVRLAPSAKQGPPPPGWDVSNSRSERSCKDDPTPRTYPVLLAQAPPPPTNHVRVTHAYTAKHKDELTLQPGQIIVLLKSREDGWCTGELHGRTGLFPGNYVTEA